MYKRQSYDVPQKTFFPGANNITSLSPETNADYISWNSGKPSVSFSDIKLDGSQVRLSVKTKANLKAEVSARPVSYTHLDVYKRQDKGI